MNDGQRKLVIDQAAARLGLPGPAVEKDLWVTAVLQLVFSLPLANVTLFKGGSSLSKIWHLINRMSEDIDLAIDRRLFGMEGELTVRQIKKLRKGSSIFVRETFAPALDAAIRDNGLEAFCSISIEPDGVGDKTYPEPRKVFVSYRSVYPERLPYLHSDVVLEVGARSLFEPVEQGKVRSLVSEVLGVETDITDVQITTATARKTFLEKAFLLHEIFSRDNCSVANRRSRHLYDLEKMMDLPLADAAIHDDALWENIRHHRKLLTHVRDVDYSPDVRDRIVLLPPEEFIPIWRDDYLAMTNAMLYGDKIPFDRLAERMSELERRFRQR